MANVKTAPEPVYAKRRPAVGFFAKLTPEQQKRALDYHGPENVGEPELSR